MATILSTEPSSTINLHLSCHCRTFSSTLTLPSTSFPLKSALCHCSICRHATGHLFATFAALPPGIKLDCTSLANYNSSKNFTRYFCPTCGCSICNDDRTDNEWELATGVISGITSNDPSTSIDPRTMSRGPGSPEGPSHNIHRIDNLLNRTQIWVGSTAGDGGAAIWLNGGTLPGMPRKFENRSSPTVTDDSLAEMSRAARSENITNSSSSLSGLRLKYYCACGGVEMAITRPDRATRYQAGLDACWSCRKSNGFEVTSWATVPASSVVWADGRMVRLDEPEIQKYSTTPGKVDRYFCKGCGAAVLCVIAGKETWDVSVGLIEGEGEGARVEGWLVWTKYGDRCVRDVGDAIDSVFVGGLVEGVRRDREAGGE